MVGIWLLVPEHLRLGTWPLLCHWTQNATEHLQPRLAMQLIHEAALCSNGIREQRTLSQKGFELANGLPFVATDTAIHALLNQRTVEETEKLQLVLGKIRFAKGHYTGRLMAVDPHRMTSSSKRQMRRRSETNGTPVKTSQTFFSLDADSCQPICFTMGTAARTVAQATPELLALTSDILTPRSSPSLVMVDTEHYVVDLIDEVHRATSFDLLMPAPRQPRIETLVKTLPEENYTRRWAGFATAKIPFRLHDSRSDSYWLFVERDGERSEDYRYKAFLATRDRDEVMDLTRHFPARWHIEEFFNHYSDMGWKRAGTLNLNVRYAKGTLALFAQAACYQLRQRLDEPYASWNAKHFAEHIFSGLDGDIRVENDTIVVTFYNAPNTDRLAAHYADLPQKLEREGIDPRIPWLYDFKLDFRFK